MKKYFSPFLTAMAAVVLVACSKSDEDTTFYGIRAQVDGVELVLEQSMVNSMSSGYSFIIYGYNKDDQEGILIEFENAIAAGTYDLANSEVSMEYVKGDSYGFDFDSGTITFDQFWQDGKFYYTATFSGIASHNFMDVGDVVITDGEMNVTF